MAITECRRKTRPAGVIVSARFLCRSISLTPSFCSMRLTRTLAAARAICDRAAPRVKLFDSAIWTNNLMSTRSKYVSHAGSGEPENGRESSIADFGSIGTSECVQKDQMRQYISAEGPVQLNL